VANVLRESNPPNKSEASSKPLWSHAEAVVWFVVYSGHRERATYAREYHEKHIAEGGQP